MSKAFNSLYHPLTLAKLKAYGVEERSLRLMGSYFTDRYNRVKLGSVVSEWQRVTRGCPQGSAFGPLIWNIFQNDLTYTVDANMNMYACLMNTLPVYLLWFNFILGLKFIFFCFKLITLRYHTQNQKQIKFKPKMNLNHNINMTNPSICHVSQLAKLFSATVWRNLKSTFWFNVVLCSWRWSRS